MSSEEISTISKENSENVSLPKFQTKEENGNVRKKRKDGEKCKNCKRCFGFCDFLSTSWKLFKEFSQDTSIHGIKYLTDKQRHWTEKLFWSIALSLSIAACSYLIYDSLIRCLKSPLLLSFSPKSMNIWQIPFAALTICPTWGAKESPLNANYNYTLLSSKEAALKAFNESLETRITNLRFRNQPMNASDFFTPVITSEGFCFTANMMNFEDLFYEDVRFEAFEKLRAENSKIPTTKWLLHDGYGDNRDPFARPHRVSSAGENGGIKFEIWRKITEVKESSNYNKGFKLALHLPSEIPQFDRQHYRFPLEKSATLSIRPSMIVTEGLESYSLHHRKCYFGNERKLTLFKMYTRSNCLLECLALHMNSSCACIHFSMPRLHTDRICDLSKEKCTEEARKSFYLQNMKRSLETSQSYDDQGEVLIAA